MLNLFLFLELLQTYVFPFIPYIIVAGLIWTIVRAGRQPLWAEAFRRLRRNRLALLALAIICFYGLIAFCDSIGWQDDKNAPQRSLIDRAFEREKEPTYSAPFATTTTGEPKPRKLKGKHWLGTDGVGADVLYLTLKGCRTAMIIGGLTSLIVTPLALLFGLLAGYFGKRVDDAIQYVYTVLDICRAPARCKRIEFASSTRLPK